MSAYVIVDILVQDQKKYDEYKLLAPATVAAYGGKYLARGGKTEVLEGEWNSKSPGDSRISSLLNRQIPGLIHRNMPIQKKCAVFPPEQIWWF